MVEGVVERDPLDLGSEYELVSESEECVPRGRTGARFSVVQALYASDLTNRPASQCLPWVFDELGLKRKERRFAESLMELVEGDREGTDALIDGFARWSFSEASEVILRNVLRLAFSELKSGSVSAAVVINEAVTLSKLLTTDGGGRFVNGVLGAYVRSDGHVSGASRRAQ